MVRLAQTNIVFENSRDEILASCYGIFPRCSGTSISIEINEPVLVTSRPVVYTEKASISNQQATSITSNYFIYASLLS